MSEPILLNPGPSERGWHRIQSFLQCPQKFAWRHKAKIEDRVKGQESPALVKGSLIHIGLAHYYAQMQAEQNGQDPGMYYGPKAAIEKLASIEGDGWRKHTEICKQVIDAYRMEYAHERIRPLYIETVFEAKFKGHRLTGRLDLVYEDTRGKIWVMDHKTTGHLHARQRTYYSVSGQLLAYKWMGQAAFGDRFGGLLLNQIQHGGKAFKFVRPHLDPAPHLFAALPQTIDDAEAGIAQLEQSDRQYFEWPKATNELTCFSRYGACGYLEKCRWGQ